MRPAAPAAGWFAVVAVAVAALTGCQASAELELYRPGLGLVVPLAARRAPGPVLEVGLLDIQHQAISDQQRIEVGQQTLWTSSLGPGDFALEALALAKGGGSPAPVAPAPVVAGVAFRPRAPASVHLCIVLDNSAAAALADAGGRRVTALLALVDRILCAAGAAPPRCDPAGAHLVSLVLLQDGAATPALQPTGERERAIGALAGLTARAGGAAPLWDGLDRARQLLVATSGAAVDPGRAGAALLVWSSPGDSISTIGPAQLGASWGGAVPLLVVITPGPGPGAVERPLLELAASSGGVLLAAADTTDLQELILGAGGAGIAGRWALELSALPGAPLQVSPGELDVSGTLSCSPGSTRVSRAFRLPLLAR